MTTRRSPRSNIHTHTYTHDRIKVMTALGRSNTQQTLSIKPTATDIKPVAEGIIKNSSPRVSIGGDEFFSKQLKLDNLKQGESGPIAVRVWHCLVLEQQNKREWLVICSDDAIPAPKYGFVCDCSRWTWGDDENHTPMYSRVTDKVVAGRRRTECRK